MVPEKAPHLAIDAARLRGLQLRLAGPIVDAAFWEAEVAPRLGEDVHYAGHLGPPRARGPRRREPRRAHDARVGGTVRSRGGRGDGDGHPGRRVRARWPARDRDPRRRRARTTRGRPVLGGGDPSCGAPAASGRPRASDATPGHRRHGWSATSACTAGSSRPGATRRSSPHEDRLVRPSPRLRPPHAPLGGASGISTASWSSARWPRRRTAAAWIRLARDDDGEPRDATAGGSLHWAPLRHPGLRSRAAAVSAWIERERPDVMVVDVSIEIALLARLHGVPVVLVAQRGIRHDAAHALAYAQAAAIAAPWTAATHLPARARRSGCSPSPGPSRGSTTSRRADAPDAGRRRARPRRRRAATICARRTCSPPRGRLPIAGGTSPARCGRRTTTNVIDHGPSGAGARRCCARARSSSAPPGRTSSPRSQRRVGRSSAFPSRGRSGSRRVRPRRSADWASRPCARDRRARRNGPGCSPMSEARPTGLWESAARRSRRVAPRRRSFATWPAAHESRRRDARTRSRPAPPATGAGRRADCALRRPPTSSSRWTSDPPDLPGATVVHRPLPRGRIDPARGGAQRDDRRRGGTGPTSSSAWTSTACLPRTCCDGSHRVPRPRHAAATSSRVPSDGSPPSRVVDSLPRPPSAAARAMRRDAGRDRWLRPDAWSVSRGWSCSGRCRSR